MGIRIHKYLGWGLTDVKCQKGELVDPRFAKKPEYVSGTDNFKFADWLKENKQQAIDLLVQADGIKAKDAQYFVDLHTNPSERVRFLTWGFNDELLNPKVMLFTPITCPDWQRYDDMIDYCENPGISKAKVKVLKNSCGLYPWLNMVKIPYAPSYEGEHKNHFYWQSDSHVIGPANYNQLVGRWDKRQPPIAKGAELEYLLKWYRPTIAPEVILYIHYLGIFTNWRETIQELRPMIYTFWG